jgi:hypothetical protein
MGDIKTKHVILIACTVPKRKSTTFRNELKKQTPSKEKLQRRNEDRRISLNRNTRKHANVTLRVGIISFMISSLFFTYSTAHIPTPRAHNSAPRVQLTYMYRGISKNKMMSRRLCLTPTLSLNLACCQRHRRCHWWL